MARRLQLQLDVSENLLIGLFYDQAVERGLSRFLAETWPTSAKLEAGESALGSKDPRGSSALFELDGGGLAYAHVGFGIAFVHVAAATEQAATDGVAEIQELLPRAVRDDEGRVPVTFWSYSPHGPMPMRRELSVPTWAEIEHNYPPQAGRSLARIMQADLPLRGGQLLLWHGETGTGKTTALRALAREWASWCETHYITDPEKFFGEQADYMLSVMLEESDMDPDDGDFIEFGPLHMVGSTIAASLLDRSGERERPSWRLLVLEDTGELLSADARAAAGQGLSRFLNVVDGLIGQGLRVLVLVTTNEEIGRLHPAVARPGRSAANVVFGRLAEEEANKWLQERGHDPTATGPMTLASLYAITEGWEAVAAQQSVGFG
ncbi:MAG TPA: DUF5925 domain-containing protein [Gaiellaceae bacterium]|nr:DUF5925 domain-containing protein [Gaiellaceae bacterium]